MPIVQVATIYSSQPAKHLGDNANQIPALMTFPTWTWTAPFQLPLAKTFNMPHATCARVTPGA